MLNLDVYFSQILALFDEIDLIDRDKTASFISSMQQTDGSFTGDKWGMCGRNYLKIHNLLLKLHFKIKSLL